MTGQFVLIWTTFFILSDAINWPASLDDPAFIALPRLVEHEGAVLAGYGAYLIGAVLLVPAAAALNASLGLKGGLAGAILALATLSAMAKTVGITRWLFVMPELAHAYMEPGADRATIALLFDALNAYAGGVGEIVGVGLMSGAWTILIGAVLLSRPGGLAKAVGGFAILMGSTLFLNIPAGFGVDLGPVLTISNIGWQFALLAVGLSRLAAPKAR
ncbi:MAG: DUF4386 family protein [Hyphomonadaceae bacterium]|nr:DUF4386 family protein [Hyphomonadaceae bacterium]